MARRRFRILCAAIVLFYFFFSSRRRHTRFDCDWSSDVCSSDLAVPVGLPMLVRAFGVNGSSLIASAYAADSPGAQPEQGDLVHIPGASAPTKIGRASCRERG